MSLGPSPAAERATLLEQVRIYLNDRLREPGATVTASDLMARLRLGWNLACSLMEHLEKVGELERVKGASVLTWSASRPPCPRGNLLHLSPAESDALQLLLASTLEGDALPPRVFPYLRDLQARLKEHHG